ncbi:MAG TPA: flagellar filament capping protein FliD, partial [Azospira sp.]|nr:flagellar filament capping protein FliD [Azospira sp.]
MDLSSLNSIYAFYNPYGLYGLSGSSPLSSLTGVNRAQESSSVGAVGNVGASSQTNVSSLGKTLSAIGNLQSAASKLAQPGAFSALSTTTSAANVASGNAATGTAQGAYTVKVDQLAQAQQLKSSAQSSQYDTIGSGADTTVNFQFANGRSASVNLTGSDNTLKGLAEAINRSDIGVSAKVVSGSEGYQLQLTGQTGAANAFTVSATGDATLSGFFSSPPGGNGLLLSQQAQDAQGSVNGTAFNASTNNVSTSVEGLSLKLSGTGTTTVSVGTNANQSKAVTDFVTAYNAVQTGVSSLAREYPGFSLSAPFLRSGLS